MTFNPVVLSLFEECEEKLSSPIFLVGGYLRDTLLGRESSDLDFACPVKPEVLASAFPDATLFIRYGTVTFKEQGYHLTLASFRKEGEYLDHRHPSYLSFSATLEEDSCRRDFTVNAIYAKKDGSLIDPQHGLEDLKEKKIRIIGKDKAKRLREDPLRILRAYRFALRLGFSLEEESEKALEDSLPLLQELNPDKIKEEVAKAGKEHKKALLEACHLYYLYPNDEGEKKHHGN